jgi:hypothetical protein
MGTVTDLQRERHLREVQKKTESLGSRPRYGDNEIIARETADDIIEAIIDQFPLAYGVTMDANGVDVMAALHNALSCVIYARLLKSEM